MKLEAHMGVSTDCPCNTNAAFRAAAEQGYAMIELDPNFTSDGVLVVLHDNTINRTARNRNGSVIESPVEIQKISYEEAASYDYGLHFSEAFAGEPLPRLADVFSFAEEKDIPLKIDNKFEKFPEHIQEKLFAMIEKSGAEAGLTVSSVEGAKNVSERLKDIPIHYDGPVDEQILRELTRLTKNLTVWLPLKCERTSWVKVPFADEILCALVKKYASLGIWIITNEEDYAAACAFGPDIIETDGSIKPKRA
ncbi:MAG: hypothetical protein LUE90_05695 [Clostridiales bacterium]|nr:hypothetical protein [Clostridiales bacterium]